MKPILHFVLALLAVSTAACGAARTPTDAVQATVDALASGKVERARALHTDNALAGLGEDRWDSYAQARRNTAGELRRSTQNSATSSDIRARLPLQGEQAVELVWEDGGWRILGGVGPAVDALTPRGTLLTFIRAVDTADTALLMSVVPPAFRADLPSDRLQAWFDAQQTELTAMAAMIAASLDQPVAESGDRATFRYGTRSVELVREDNRWYIRDFN
jgi:hypothetical protein